MNERRKQGILLLFPVVVLLLGIIFTTTLFYHTYRQIAYQHISAFCEILLENSPEAEPQLLSSLKEYHSLSEQEDRQKITIWECMAIVQENFAKNFQHILSSFLSCYFLRFLEPLS